MARIAVAGFQHETNTFVDRKTELSAFLEPDAWPGLIEGAAIAPAVKGMNLPIAGFLEAIDGRHQIVPLLWCSAPPGGPVSDDAFEAIAGRLLGALADSLPIDALYLDLHGAMVTESVPDAEGEMLGRLGDLLGPQVPVFASIDYHANVSRRMIAGTRALVAYRTYPHVDMAQTGAGTWRLVRRHLAGQRWHAAARTGLPMRPLVWQSTASDPMHSIMHEVVRLETGDIASLSVAAGFPLADIDTAGASVLAYGGDEAALARTVDSLAARLSEESGEPEPVYTPADAIGRARSLMGKGGPVILADVQDNPGAGGSSDTVGLLAHLLAADLPGKTALGVMCDPEAAAAAHEAGNGGSVKLSLGAKAGRFGERPIADVFEVRGLGNGRFRATGPFYGGCSMDLGPMACLRCKGVDIVVSSRPQQAADQAMFRHVGVDPATCRLLALKSAVHFRADFGAIAQAVLITVSPGANPVDLRQLDYRRYKGPWQT